MKETDCTVLAEGLQGYEAELERLNKSTEDDFLTLGSHLIDVSSQAGEITETASSAARLISGEELSDAVEALQGILDRMNRHLNGSEDMFDNSSEILKKTLCVLEDAHQSLTGFNRIVKRLRVLGISTKIESARLLHTDGSFDTLAGDVENLSVIIGSKAAQILNGLAGLQTIIEEALSKVLFLKTSGESRTREVVGNIAASMSFLLDKHATAKTTANRLAAMSGEVSTHIGGIVASLQFHDITRQQIDHVRETLREVVRRLTEGSRAGNGSDDENRLKVLSDVTDISDLQASQLLHARNELASAVYSVMERLQKVIYSTGDMSHELTGLIGVTGQTGSTFLTELDCSMSLVAKSLEENTKGNTELERAVNAVIGTITDLSSFVSDIEEIGVEIELIALNARIKAAHTGVQGAALGILAEEIRQLSETARRQTIFITNAMKSINSAASLLSSKEESLERDGSKEVEEMVSEIDSLIGLVGGVNDSVGSLLRSVQKESQRLESAIETTLQGIRVHHVAEETLGRIADGLHGVSGDVRRVIPSSVRNGAASGLSELAARYTMKQERSIHQSHLSHGARDDENGLSEGMPSYHEFGENVELF
jgi:methyl-accepting chemotaxis protein